ncbi:MAG: PIG-L family deacetylase [Fimbriimonadaceae bacterium]|nr:PIG-L family deacetylase [Fimbriimonadaceae bacterium]
MKVLCLGAHPDDPETGMGGTLRRYALAGDSVTVLYLTGGEAGIADCPPDEARRIRTSEAEAACRILGVSPRWFAQVDGDTLLNRQEYERMHEVFREEGPDVVFTHWPQDSHRDHRVCAALALDAWMAVCGPDVPLYHYEVMRGTQTFCWQPTDWVDTSDVLEAKRAASFAHVSQKIAEVYDEDHGVMERLRGLENGTRSAEGFLRQHPGASGRLPV